MHDLSDLVVPYHRDIDEVIRDGFYEPNCTTENESVSSGILITSFRGTAKAAHFAGFLLCSCATVYHEALYKEIRNNVQKLCSVFHVLNLFNRTINRNG